AGADILGGRPGVIARGLQMLYEWFAGSVIELVTFGHSLGLRLREPHQLWIERNRRQPVVGAVSGDHRSGGGRVELGTWLCQVTVETRPGPSAGRGGPSGKAGKRPGS